MEWREWDFPATGLCLLQSLDDETEIVYYIHFGGLPMNLSERRISAEAWPPHFAGETASSPTWCAANLEAGHLVDIDPSTPPLREMPAALRPSVGRIEADAIQRIDALAEQDRNGLRSSLTEYERTLIARGASGPAPEAWASPTEVFDNPALDRQAYDRAFEELDPRTRAQISSDARLP
jgi:hypothetical protein